MKIAIIGMGVVGQAQEKLFAGHDLVTYDTAWGKKYPRQKIRQCDFAVVTVGTPPRKDGTANLGHLWDALDSLPTMAVMVRSTIPPGTTQRLEGDFPGHAIAHVPEFLYEGGTGPWRESGDVPFMILGGSGPVRGFFRHPLREVFPGKIHETTALTAELAKFTANLHWANRVTFVNEMAGICEAFGADWEDVREAWLQDERVHPDHTKMAGFPPGFGGRCWPGNLIALIRAATAQGYEPGYLWSVYDANARFRGE